MADGNFSECGLAWLVVTICVGECWYQTSNLGLLKLWHRQRDTLALRSPEIDIKESLTGLQESLQIQAPLCTEI
jgi:hypothetical protein